MISFDGLTVRYGSVVALDGVSGQVADGEWLGLIGPNGAGKTTLLNAIARLLPPAGDVIVCGQRANEHDIHSGADEARDKRRLDEIAGQARVLADDDRVAVRPPGKPQTCRLPKSQGYLCCHRVGVGGAADTVGSKQAFRPHSVIRPLHMNFNDNARGCGEAHPRLRDEYRRNLLEVAFDARQIHRIGFERFHD